MSRSYVAVDLGNSSGRVMLGRVSAERLEVTEIRRFSNAPFRRPFDLFVTAERIRARKPDLWHFRAFQLLSQTRKDHWVHITSDWQHDLVPAEVFGIQRVWFDRNGTGEDPSRATVHVRTAADAVKAVDWLFQEQAACAC